MGRELSRHELLVEAASAAEALRAVSSFGDRRRYDDDRVFRYAAAFAWPRFTEPLCRLITGRLVGDDARRTWAGMCDIRNMLAHERDQDIDFAMLWALLGERLPRTEAQLDWLMVDG
ncbi:MAG: hypothetical protein QG597_5211 [Actinomycetota bacterium]|nr:hypothetical protein [Actinomycetota bacterium]